MLTYISLNKYITCVAKISSSPSAKRARKAYMLLNQKAEKQNAAPRNVATDRICKNEELECAKPQKY